MYSMKKTRQILSLAGIALLPILAGCEAHYSVRVDAEPVIEHHVRPHPGRHHNTPPPVIIVQPAPEPPVYRERRSE